MLWYRVNPLLLLRLRLQLQFHQRFLQLDWPHRRWCCRWYRLYHRRQRHYRVYLQTEQPIPGSRCTGTPSFPAQRLRGQPQSQSAEQFNLPACLPASLPSSTRPSRLVYLNDHDMCVTFILFTYIISVFKSQPTDLTIHLSLILNFDFETNADMVFFLVLM